MSEAALYDFLKLICQPYLFLLLGLGIGILAAWRRSASGRKRLACLMFLWLGIFLLSLPCVSHVLMGTLESGYEPLAVLPEDVEGIILLGGGTDPPNEFRSYAIVNGSSFYRSRFAADLYEQLDGCPLIVCGGQTDPADISPTEAEVIRGVLIEMAVKDEDLLLESKSLSTHENARFAAEIIKQHGLKNLLLVTHGRHMKRAELCFRKQGVEVIPAACGLKTNGEAVPAYVWVIPSPEALETSHVAIREWIGIAWYWLRGRI